MTDPGSETRAAGWAPWPRVQALLMLCTVSQHPLRVSPAGLTKLPYHEGKMLAFEVIGISVLLLQVWGLLTLHAESSNEFVRLEGTR